MLFVISAGAYSTPQIVNMRTFRDSVGIYDKYEINLNIKAQFVNPFDPAEIDIMATFTSPTGKQWKIPGFYYYAFFSDWKVRFSPDEKGTWKYKILVKDKTGEISSEEKTFYVSSSTYHGPVRIASNKRYLEHFDGTPFFGVGLWYNDGYTAFNRGRIEPDELDNFKELGINFIATFITPLETWGSGLGRYDQNLCGRLDEVLGFLEERDMYLSLNIWFHSYLSETVWGGGNIRWETNPYQLITPARDFYSSDEAWKYQEKLYRYMIARWGYSRSLYSWHIVDEVNGTDGWVSGDSLGAANWSRKIQDFFNKHDPYRHPTTGTRSGGIREWWPEGYEIYDMAGREIYEAQGFPINRSGNLDSTEIHPLTYSYRNYAGQVQRLWKEYYKPAVIPETGWDHTFYEMSMPGYQAMYHNTLWVCLATGSATSPYWWAHSRALNDNVLTYQLLNYRRFADQIPFSKLTNLAPVTVKTSEGDGYAIESDQLIFGWAANCDRDMAGVTITLPSVKNKKYKLRLYHTWRGQFILEKEVEARRNSVSFDMPVLKIEGGHARYIGQDVAFILEKLE